MMKYQASEKGHSCGDVFTHQDPSSEVSIRIRNCDKYLEEIKMSEEIMLLRLKKSLELKNSDNSLLLFLSDPK